MRQSIILALITTVLCISLSAQVPDSTFGVPSSFGAPWEYWPAVTGCDFDGREDRSFTSLFLPDGKIILAGHSHDSDSSDFALVRLLPDGKFDTTAGPEGQIRVNLGYQNDSCLSAALYDSGLIVMGGCVTLPGRDGYSLLVARVDIDGYADPFFGDNGHTVIDLPTGNEMVIKIIVLPDGKILIAGNAFFGHSFNFPDSTTVFVGRLLPNGQVDSTFGTDGFVYRRYEYTCKSSILYDVALDNEGRIVLSGGSYSPYPGSYYVDDFCTHNIYVCRYLPDGQPDPAFGNNGMQELPFSKGRATTLYIEKDNRILIGGVVTLTWLIPEPHYSFIARLMPDGTPDVSFANNGRFVELLSSVSGSAELVSIIKIDAYYYFGFVDEANGDHSYFGLTRFTENGDLDSLFGKDGVYTTRLWLPTTLYNINQIYTIDEQSIYLSGYYSKLSQDNMMICKVKLNKTISSTESDPILSVNIFPNPFSSSIAVRLNQGGKTASFRLYNQLGQLALTTVVAPGENSIATGHLLPGIYFWEIISADGLRLSGKIIK